MGAGERKIALGRDRGFVPHAAAHGLNARPAVDVTGSSEMKATKEDHLDSGQPKYHGCLGTVGSPTVPARRMRRLP